MVVDKSAERVKKMFSEIAPRYDLLNHVLSLNVDKLWRTWTVKLVPPTGNSPILDVCTGTGDLALAYLRATGGETPITATDFCGQMLEIGESKQEKIRDRQNYRHGVEFIEADTTRLPFDDNRFQIVCVAFGLRNVCDTDAGLREMTRVALPGGRVAVLEFSQPTWQPFRAIYQWYFTKILPKIGQMMARNDHSAYSYLPESVGQFPSGQALASQMESAGLKNVWFRPFTGGIATLYVGVKRS